MFLSLLVSSKSCYCVLVTVCVAGHVITVNVYQAMLLYYNCCFVFCS